MRVYPVADWCDFWVGVFWDRGKRRLYILPVPCLGIMIQFKPWYYIEQETIAGTEPAVGPTVDPLGTFEPETVEPAHLIPRCPCGATEAKDCTCP